MISAPQSRLVVLAGRTWWASNSLVWLHLLVFYAFVARVWLAVGHDPALVPDSPVHASSYFPEMQNVLVITTLLALYGGVPAQLTVFFAGASNDKQWRLGITLFNAMVLTLHLFGRHFYWFSD